MERILVTGLSGLIGTAATPALADRYDLTALNRRDVGGVRTIRADLESGDPIDAAFEGIDTVVHLAAKISDDAGWNALLALNVVGTRNVFEAARSNGVRRVVFASSGATVSGWERSEPYKAIVEGRYEDVPRLWDLVDEDMAPRPGNLYASTKVWGEAIARHYAQSYGIEVSCLRIGYVNDRDAPSDPRQYAVWLSQRDVVQGLLRAIEHSPEDGFDTFFLTSRNKWGYRSIRRAETRLDFSPVDEAEQHR